MRLLPHLIENNRKWAESVLEEDPEFFAKLAGASEIADAYRVAVNPPGKMSAEGAVQ